jgi:class 3 adenylate cyclase
MIGINVFSLVDLLAVIISTHVLLVFLYRWARVTRRRVDLLFSGVMLLVLCESFFVLASDNVIPAGVAAASVSGAASRTLLWYRLMYIAGTLLMATLTHFTLRYAQSQHLSGWRVAWLYIGALAITPLYFSDEFLRVRDSPLQSTSGWLCAVPWQPDSGRWTFLFILLWLAVNVYIHWLLWRRPYASSRGSVLDQRNFVWCGVALWGVAGLVSTLLGSSGYAGVDPTMFLVTGAMVVLAIGLAEDHRHSEVRNGFITEVFGRYVARDVVEKLLDDPNGLKLGGEKRVVSVLMCDLRGFTIIAERLPPERVVEMLNIYLSSMAEVVTAHRGIINDFIGDGILAMFGAPIRRDDFTESAVRCAIAMQSAMKDVNERIAQFGVPPLDMGIGINTGEVVVGNIGSLERAKYGVVGNTVNLASRIESATVGGQILVSRSTIDALPGILEILGEMTVQVKGAAEPMTVFDIGGITGERPLRLPVADQIWSRFAEPCRIQCAFVSDQKQIVGSPFAADLIALCATSAQLDTSQMLDLSTNLRMRVLGAGACGAPDVYGKVVSGGSTPREWIVRFTSPAPNAWRGAADNMCGNNSVRPRINANERQ